MKHVFLDKKILLLSTQKFQERIREQDHFHAYHQPKYHKKKKKKLIQIIS